MTRYHFVNIMRWQFRVGAWSNLSYTCRSSGFIGFDHTPNKIITSWYSRNYSLVSNLIHYWFFFSIDKLTTIDWLNNLIDRLLLWWLIDLLIDYSCSHIPAHQVDDMTVVKRHGWFLGVDFNQLLLQNRSETMFGPPKHKSSLTTISS